MEELVLELLRNPANYVGLVLGLFIAFFTSHMGWVVTGSAAKDAKAANDRAATAEAKLAALEARLDAAIKTVASLEKDLEPYKEWERRRMQEAMRSKE